MYVFENDGGSSRRRLLITDFGGNIDVRERGREMRREFYFILLYLKIELITVYDFQF